MENPGNVHHDASAQGVTMSTEPGPALDEYRWIDGRLLQWDGTGWVVPLGGAGPDQQPADEMPPHDDPAAPWED